MALAAALTLAGAPGLSMAASALSPLQKLVIENDIRQQIILFGLLADGDGISHKDVRAVADQTLAPDVVTDVILPDGRTASHTTTSQEVVDATPKPVERPAAGPPATSRCARACPRRSPTGRGRSTPSPSAILSP